MNSSHNLRESKEILKERNTLSFKENYLNLFSSVRPIRGKINSYFAQLLENKYVCNLQKFGVTILILNSYDVVKFL